jgi:hypothetical protein
MISALVALAALAPAGAPPLQVAFIARFYYSYPDERISSHQVYVSGLDGKNRRALTTGNTSPQHLAWVGKNKLSWVEQANANKVRLVLYDLKSRHRRVLLQSNYLVQIDDDLFEEYKFPIYDDGAKRYQVTESGLKTLGKSPEFKWRGEVETWHLPGEPLIRFLGHEEDPSATNLQFPDYNYIYTFERDGRRYKWSLEGEGNYFYPCKKLATAYLHSVQAGASAGSWEALYEVNWTSGTLRRLISDACAISIRKGSDHWSGLEPGRTLSPYGPKKNVWTCEASVGNLKTGKRWAIASGLAECYEIALSP